MWVATAILQKQTLEPQAQPLVLSRKLQRQPSAVLITRFRPSDVVAQIGIIALPFIIARGRNARAVMVLMVSLSFTAIRR